MCKTHYDAYEKVFSKMETIIPRHVQHLPKRPALLCMRLRTRLLQ